MYIYIFIFIHIYVLCLCIQIRPRIAHDAPVRSQTHSSQTCSISHTHMETHEQVVIVNRKGGTSEEKFFVPPCRTVQIRGMKKLKVCVSVWLHL